VGRSRRTDCRRTDCRRTDSRRTGSHHSPNAHGASLTTSLAAIDRYLHDHIPLSGHLGARVIEAGYDALRITAPLEPNLNHRGTAFGGSIAALAILSGWTWLFVNLQGDGFEGRIVIQSNTMDYVAPGEGEFTATCRAPSAERWAHLREMVRERGRGRI